MKNEILYYATFSACRTYRYQLWRRWGEITEPYCMFIGLNPSTADEIKDDPTVRRCINYAKTWGYGSLCMTNIFAFRATDPKEMMKSKDPVGPENDIFLKESAKNAGIIIAAWGKDGKYKNREKEIIKTIKNLHCLKINGDGSPSHPLYLKKTLTPIKFNL